MADGTEDTAYTVSTAALVTGFTDADGDSLSVVNLTANHGSVADNGNDTWTITPTPNYNGAVSLAYQVVDGNGGSATATQSFTLAAVNDAPTVAQALVDESATEGAAFSYVVPANAFADVDAGDTLSYSAARANGSALPGWLTFDAASRTFSGTPGAGDSGSFDIRVAATDTGSASVSDVFALTIGNTNDAPTGAATAVLPDGTEDTTYLVSTAALVTGFTDADGDTLAVANLTANHGSVADNGNGTWTITPTANFNGAVGLAYRVVDGNGGSAAATQSFSVKAVNDAPTVAQALVDQNATEGAAFSYVVPANAFADVDSGDTLSFAARLADGSALPAWLSFDPATRGFTGAPGAGDSGSVDIRVTATDSGNASVSDVFALTIGNTNDAPTGSPAAKLVDGTEDTPYQIAAADLLAGFSDADGDALSVANLTSNHGSVTANGNATWTITPTANYNGEVSLGYNVVDGNGGSVTATQRFTLAAVNDAPTGTATAVLPAGTEDTNYVVSTAALVTGFTDADGDTLAVANLTANHGSVVNNGNGAWTITPTANYNGAVNLGYNVIDGNGGNVAATQSFIFTAVNDAPVAQARSDAATEGGALVTGSVLASDMDEGAVLTYSLTATAPVGLTFKVDGSYSFDPTVVVYNALKAGATQAVVANYRVSDGIADDTSTLTITITGTNDAPIAVNDTTNTNRNTPVTVAVRANDSDPDGDQLAVTAVTQAANGTVTIDATTGNPTYTPNNAYSGTDSFTYTIGDGQGGTATATVAVTVAGGIYGDAQANTLNGTTGDDLIFGLGGDDTINARAGVDAVDGGDGNDTITGGAGADTLAGGSGDDTFIAGGAELTGDSISGGTGNDTLSLSGNTTLTGAFSFDTLETLDMNQRNLTVNTTQAVDLSSLSVRNAGTIQGSALNNAITGTAGNDTIDGLAGNDVLNGAGGVDAINGGAGTDSINGGDGNDSISGGADADTLDGGIGDDTFIAGGGELTGDTISGGAGNDTLALRSNTTLAGALTFDTLETLDMGGFTLTVNSAQAVDLSSLTVLNVGTIQGSAVDNAIKGTAGNDTLNGLAGNDTIDGAAGNDVINGGAGADTLRGGEGNDTFVVSGAQLNGDVLSGGAGDDKLLLSSNTGISGAFTFDSLETLDMNGMTLNLNTTQAIDLSSLRLLNGGLIEGNGSTNTITGTAGNDTINGLGAADLLNGAGGNDVIYGGTGGDRISGGQGSDSLYARLDATTDTTTDTFVWQWGDPGSPGAPAVDNVFGFSTRSAASGGDVLDLSGMLQGAATVSLSEFLCFQHSGG